MARQIIPDIVCDRDIVELTPGGTARQAAQLMAARNVAAVVITEGGRLKGIVTERDITTRVVAKGLNPDTTLLSQVMTADPDTLDPSDNPLTALTMMRERGYRHLPVLSKAGKVVCMVSIRDLYAAVQDALERDLKERDAFIFGEDYGAGH